MTSLSVAWAKEWGHRFLSIPIMASCIDSLRKELFRKGAGSRYPTTIPYVHSFAGTHPHSTSLISPIIWSVHAWERNELMEEISPPIATKDGKATTIAPTSYRRTGTVATTIAIWAPRTIRLRIHLRMLQEIEVQYPIMIHYCVMQIKCKQRSKCC